jgi:HSP20 family protein
MKNELMKRNIRDEVPAFFGGRDLFRGFNKEFEEILSGKCDFEEDNDKYVVEIEVPGVKKEEINIGLKNDILTVSWKRIKETKKELKNSRYERNEGCFTRSFNVEGTDEKKIDAELKNGLLKIVLFKNDAAKAKKIEIK